MSGAAKIWTQQEAKEHVKTYLLVFVALLFLTVVTVGVSYLHLRTHVAILVALAVAGFKGSLVALFFMHLSHEKRIIYWSLALTATFFVFLMTISFY